MLGLEFDSGDVDVVDEQVSGGAAVVYEANLGCGDGQCGVHGVGVVSPLCRCGPGGRNLAVEYQFHDLGPRVASCPYNDLVRTGSDGLVGTENDETDRCRDGSDDKGGEYSRNCAVRQRGGCQSHGTCPFEST